MNIQSVLKKNDTTDEEVGLEVQRIKGLHDARKADEDKVMATKLIKFDKVYSIYGLVEHYPNKFKETLEQLVASPEESQANSDKTIIKTVFLYFLELIGVSKDEDLQLLVEKTLSWTKE